VVQAGVVSLVYHSPFPQIIGPRMSAPKTLFDKIWERHVVDSSDDGDTLLYVDRCLIHEGSMHAFDKLREDGRTVARPSQVFAFSDHYVPTSNRHLGVAGVNDPGIRGMIEKLADNSKEHGLRLFGIDDPQHGILHVVPPELGLTQPGLLMVGADSHTSTHGALGVLSFGIGASETAHVLATQTIWQRRPGNMRVVVDGTLPFGCTAKDIILAIIGKIGMAGATGHAVEYAGSAIRALSMEGRMTVCNMTIEAGGRTGMVAPDETTFAYLKNKEYAPKGADWDAALAWWRTLPSDPDAQFSREVTLNADDITPMVTWGTSPDHALPITSTVPDPATIAAADTRADVESAISYMDLRPGMPLESIAVSRVFIGSCTNGRIEDIRAAAEVARRGKAKVPTWVVPGSASVKRAAEAEGLHHVLEAAGFEWRDPGCSMCTAINGDILMPGERCASTSNRNFRGRQGKGGRTHLVSPAMAAAAAITGHLTDVRKLVD
jgi:3-isopropylmalate/(R)-2-methylmalate dehydratase large subunit